MRTAAAIVFAGLLAGATPCIAQTVSPTAESDVAAFFRLRAEGVAAANADDVATAAARLAEADARNPNHPGLMLMRARLAVGADQPTEAMALLRHYADTGLAANLAADPTLSTLADQPGFAELTAALTANREPAGADRMSEVVRIAGARLVESVAWDPARGRWLAALVRGRTVVAVDAAGVVSPFLAEDATIGGVLGLALDPRAGVLWAATSPNPVALHGLAADAPRPGNVLLKIDAASGQVLARYPASEGESMLGDIALAADGVVFVADSGGRRLLQLKPGSEALEILLPANILGSPQGMVPTPDGAALIVADYSSGLWRVDRVTGGATRVSAPADASLIGIDGLTTDGRAIYGFQNGVAPQRVLKLTLDAGWTRIGTVEVLAANLPQIDEPTTGLVHEGELVFVSRSQWSDFDGEGALRTPEPAPALISRLRLD